jgi:hypothetical protein
MVRSTPRRSRVSKHGSAREQGSPRQFRSEVSKTHPHNMRARPMRGGFRL